MSTIWQLEMRREDGDPLPQDETALQQLLEAAVRGTGPMVVMSTERLYEEGEHGVEGLGVQAVTDSEHVRFERTLIRNMAAMTYTQAARIVEGNDPSLDLPMCSHQCKDDDCEPLVAGKAVRAELRGGLRLALLVLTLLGRQLEKIRCQAGAWDLGGAGLEESRYTFQGQGQRQGPGYDEGTQQSELNVEHGEHLEIHDTVKELMIVTNAAVAGVLVQQYGPQAFLRSHPPPSLAKLLEARNLSKQLGLPIFDSNDEIGGNGGVCGESLKKPLLNEQQRLAHNLREFRSRLSDMGAMSRLHSDSPIFAMCSSIVLETFKGARYGVYGELSSDGASHAGLGLLLYTHFTSPIRRFADVIVHQQLLGLIADDVCGIDGHGKGAGTSSAVVKETDSAKGATKDSGCTPPSINVDDNMDDLLGDLLAGVHVNSVCNEGMEMPLREENAFDVEGNLLDDLLQGIGSSKTQSTLGDKVKESLREAGTDQSITDAPPSAEGECAVVGARVRVELRQKKKCIPALDSAWLQHSATHLNSVTRRAKFIQRDCQRLFLAVSLRQMMSRGGAGEVGEKTCVKRAAIVQSICDDGVFVFIPGWECKTFVPLCDRHGHVSLPPSVLPQEQATRMQKDQTRAIEPDKNDNCTGPRRCVFAHVCCMRQRDTDGKMLLRVVRESTPNESLLEIRVLQIIHVYAWSQTHPGFPPRICVALADASTTGNRDTAAAPTPAVDLNLDLGPMSSAVTTTAAGVSSVPIHAAAAVATATGGTGNTHHHRRQHLSQLLSSLLEDSRRARLRVCTWNSNGNADEGIGIGEAAEKGGFVNDDSCIDGDNDGDSDGGGGGGPVGFGGLSTRCRRYCRGSSSSGRIFFGSLAESAEAADKAVSTSVASGTATSEGIGVPGLGGMDSASAVVQQGHRGAMMQMQAWGEVWADEEELPPLSFGGERTEGAHGQQALSRNEMRQVTAREEKLKTAKRNSRRKGWGDG